VLGSFRSQRLDGIDARGAAAGSQQATEVTSNRRRMARTKSVHHLASADRGRVTARGSDPGIAARRSRSYQRQPQAVAHDHPEDVALLRAQRHADADLAAPLADDERCHAVEASTTSSSASRPGPPPGRPSSKRQKGEDAVVQMALHRLDVIERQARSSSCTNARSAGAIATGLP